MTVLLSGHTDTLNFSINSLQTTPASWKAVKSYVTLPLQTKYFEQSKKINKVGQKQKTLITSLHNFWLLLQKPYFWKEVYALLGSISIQFWFFPNIFLLPKIPSHSKFIYYVCYARNQVPLYLWWMETLQKCWKVPKHYVQDYRVTRFTHFTHTRNLTLQKSKWNKLPASVLPICS